MTVDVLQQQHDIFALRQQVSKLQTTTDTLNRQILNLQNTTAKSTANAPQVENFIRNGDFSHSWDTHEHATLVADDTRFECWQIYTHTTPVAGQQLKEDSVFSGVAVANSKALPDPGRSDAPTSDPNWFQLSGYGRLGSTNSIDFPLPSNIAFPGRLLYVSMIMARKSANVIFSGSVAVGIWDNTAGQRDFLPAAPFAITAKTIGIPVATISRDYFALGTLDTGKTIGSSVQTNPTAPSDTSFVSGSVYTLVSLVPFPGLTSVTIYRKTGGVFVRLKTVAGGTGQYFDDGYVSEIVGAYPTGDSTIQKAYAQTRAGSLASLPIDGTSPAWFEVDFTISVPVTYNQANTTDKQWLRIFLTAVPTGSDAVKGIFIDLVRMGYVPGAFAHHPDDLKGLRQPIAAPNGSGQGGTGTGGGSFIPPDSGTGGQRCIWEECEVMGVDNRLRVAKLPAKSSRQGSLIVSPENDTFFIEQVQSVKTSWAETTLTITSELGHIRCSPTEPFHSIGRDIIASELKRGDKVLLYDETRDLFDYFKVKSIRKTKGCHVIMIMLAGRRKYFLARDPETSAWWELHNLKIE